MKLRIQGNSLRLRLGPSEVERLLAVGRVEETIHFAPGEKAATTYALELAQSTPDLSLRYLPQEITVLLSRERARTWAESGQVSIAGQIALEQGALELLVEKDFACLDRKDGQSEDAYPNPKAGAVC